jgi:histone acetyltransferase
LSAERASETRSRGAWAPLDAYHSLRGSCSAFMFRMQMKVLYPASNKLPQLSDSTLALKIARHSRCSACVTCPGLRPPPGTTVTLDEPEDTDDVDQLLSSTIDGEPSGIYLDACICGHPRSKHGADKGGLGAEEFARRARAAVRLDELLGVRAPKR